MDKDAKARSMPDTWPSSESIGHACGSVFASTLVKALSSPTGPLSVEENGEENSEEEDDDDDDEENMTYNAFCKALWDTCKDRVYRFWEHQEFTFSPDDQWVYSRSGRTGIPLAHFEQRWNQLLSHPCPAPADVRLQRNPAPTSVDLAPGSSVQQAAGVQDADSTVELIKSIFECTREMAYLLLQTCSQDWNKALFMAFAGALRNYYRLGLKSERRTTDIAAKIRFRWEMGLLTDSIISRFKLPVPKGEICILWDRYA